MYTTLRIHYRLQFGDFVAVRGSSQGLSWEFGLEATWIETGGEDVWVLTLPFHYEKEEVIYFKPLLNDEVWAKGYDYIVRPGETIDVYPFFFATQGSVFKTSIYSPSLDNTRTLAIYLPPSYNENPFKRYPLLLFQDGHNLFGPEDSYCGDTWRLDEALDSLSCNFSIQEHIVVGIYPLKREWEYLPTQCDGGGGADKYLDFLTHELRPNISQHLRVDYDATSSYPQPCAIAGSSYGGIISLYAWATRPDEFSVCGAFSPALHFDSKLVPKLVKRSLQTRPNNHKLYMDCGTIKDQLGYVVDLADHLMTHGPLTPSQFAFVVGEGHVHSEPCWAERAPGALAFLLSDPKRARFSLIEEVNADSEGEAN